MRWFLPGSASSFSGSREAQSPILKVELQSVRRRRRRAAAGIAPWGEGGGRRGRERRGGCERPAARALAVGAGARGPPLPAERRPSAPLLRPGGLWRGGGGGGNIPLLTRTRRCVPGSGCCGGGSSLPAVSPAAVSRGVGGCGGGTHLPARPPAVGPWVCVLWGVQPPPLGSCSGFSLPQKSSPFLQLCPLRLVPDLAPRAVNVCAVCSSLWSPPLHSCTQYVFAWVFLERGFCVDAPLGVCVRVTSNPWLVVRAPSWGGGANTFRETCYTDSWRSNMFYCTIISFLFVCLFFFPRVSGCWYGQRSPMLCLANVLCHAGLAEYFLCEDALSCIHLRRSVSARMFAIKI